jgi:polyisoprenoid-binding protein YceI
MASIRRPVLTALSATALLFVLGTPGAEAADRLKGKTFHFGTHPARTNIAFVSEADLETIHGRTNQLTGSVTVDATGKQATGTLRVAVADLRTGIDKRDEHLRSSQWLDADKFPHIDLQIVSAVQGDNERAWSFTGKLTIKGKTQEVKAEASVIAFDPAQTERTLGAGDWVRVRTRFDVKLSDFGVVIPQMVGAKVNDTWNLRIDLYGTTVKPAPESR